MYIVGIDAGLRHTGLVILDEKYTVESLTLIEVEPSAAKRLYDIELAVDRAVVPYKPKCIVFIEGYAYGATHQRESLAELGGVLRRWFWLNHIEYWVIPPLMIKQFATKSPRANKNFMKKCAKDRWGMHFKSDDVCDAYCIARLGVAVLTSDKESPVVEKILGDVDNYKGANTARRKKNANKQSST